MVLTIFLILLILWGVGIFTGYTMGRVIPDLRENKALKVKGEIDDIKKIVGKQA